MSDKLDFSQLSNEDETLISWEDLFPEYAIGGKSFKSGQKNVPPESGIKPTEYAQSAPSSTQTSVTGEVRREQKNIPPASGIKPRGHTQSPASSTQTKSVKSKPKSQPTGSKSLAQNPVEEIPFIQLSDFDFPEQTSAETASAVSKQVKTTEPAQENKSSTPPTSFTTTGIEVLSLDELPEIPSLTEDDDLLPDPSPTLKPTTDLHQTKNTTAQQEKHHFSSAVSLEKAFENENSWLDRALAESDELLMQAQQPAKNQDYWANRFNQLNFPGMDLMAVTYFGSFTYDLWEQSMLRKRVTRDFVRLLSYNYTNELRSAGVSEEGIFYMKKGKIPENFTVHLKYPLEYGGSIDFNNMVFMQDKPFHDAIHSYLDEQMLTPNGIEYPPLLYVPTPVGKIYVPFGMFTGSGGKNKQDRSVYAGFSKAAFDKIALKAMPGR